MRYLLITYYRRPDGKIDENLTVANKVKNSEWQTASMIMDFKEQKILKATADGTTLPKDWERIVGYFYLHYPSTLERMFQENGIPIDAKPFSKQTEEVNTN